MVEFSVKLVDYMVKYYNINRIEAQMMVEDEYDYIQDSFYRGEDDVKATVKDLLCIYMVA